MSLKEEEYKEYKPVTEHTLFTCWYAEFNRDEDRTKCYWEVGYKKGEDKDNYNFVLSEFGDVWDESFWNKITDAEFAGTLIGIFKLNGKDGFQDKLKII